MLRVDGLLVESISASSIFSRSDHDWTETLAVFFFAKLDDEDVDVADLGGMAGGMELAVWLPIVTVVTEPVEDDEDDDDDDDNDEDAMDAGLVDIF